MRYLPLIMILLAGLLLPAGAAEPLATVQIPVLDQSRSERDRAISEGMETVVLRLIGREEYLEAPEARNVIDAGSQYLQQYSYASIDPLMIEDPSTGDMEETRLAFRATFDIEAIARRLQSNGLPLWALERPLTQVWIAYSAGGERELLRSDGNSSGSNASPVAAELLKTVRAAAHRRGVPLIVPGDNASAGNQSAPVIAFTDVWGVFEEPLLEAAEAAGSNNALAVRLFREGDRWFGRFTLLGSAVDRQNQEFTGDSPGMVLAAGIDQLAETYAAEFSVMPSFGGGSEVRMEIENVARLEDYGRVVKYLSGLSAVESLAVRKVNGSRIELSLQLSGTTRALERAIEIGRVLQALDSGEVIPLGSIAGIDFATERTLRYRYRQN